MLALTPKVHVKKKKHLVVWWYLLAAPVLGKQKQADP